MAEAMAGTNASGLRSRSSQRISANISGVISFSEHFRWRRISFNTDTLRYTSQCHEVFNLTPYFTEMWWWGITIHIPSESVSELLSLNLHVQTDWNQNFRLSSVLVDHCWIVVVKAGQDKHTGSKLRDSSYNCALHSINVTSIFTSCIRKCLCNLK